VAVPLVPEASQDAWSVIWIAGTEGDALFKVGNLEAATHVGLRAFDAAQHLGFGNNFSATIVLTNAVEGLLGRGRTAEAAALIDPRITGQVDRDHWPLHACRAEIDLLRAEVDAAAQRLAQIKAGDNPEFTRDLAQLVAEAEVWAGRPDEALEEVQRALERLAGADWVVISCGWLLVVGMRACADLSERGRARRDDDAVRTALAAANDLASWVKRERDLPFSEHPYVASSPGGPRDLGRRTRPRDWGERPGRVERCRGAVGGAGCRHRAAYVRWRQADALLAVPEGGRGAASTVLSTAAGLAVEHVPLTRAIQDLARRARIDLTTPTPPVDQDEPSAARTFGLTDRELDVLRLLGQGKTNPEIAAALFISPRTAGVHVTHILRKLDATTRVQAVTIAERAGLLDVGQTDTPLAHT
jgi:DNA-binding CsgD family transcriptional regulator